LKGLLADQGGLIQAEAAQVNAKLDEQTQLIQQLQDQINQGTTVPQEVVDALMANNEAIKGIFADVAPTPAPEPVPEPAPEPGRRR
jgi:septal ring factor EnvC (AmiA/AmiB activator)